MMGVLYLTMGILIAASLLAAIFEWVVDWSAEPRRVEKTPRSLVMAAE